VQRFDAHHARKISGWDEARSPKGVAKDSLSRMEIPAPTRAAHGEPALSGRGRNWQREVPQWAGRGLRYACWWLGRACTGAGGAAWDLAGGRLEGERERTRTNRRGQWRRSHEQAVSALCWVGGLISRIIRWPARHGLRRYLRLPDATAGRGGVRRRSGRLPLPRFHEASTQCDSRTHLVVARDDRRREGLSSLPPAIQASGPSHLPRAGGC